MKTIEYADAVERERLIGVAKEAEKSLMEAVSEFNRALEDARDELRAAVAHYNDIVGEASDLRDTVVAALEDHFQDQSEKWQETPQGEAFQTWIDGWADLEFENAEIEIPEPIDEPNLTLSNILEVDSRPNL